MNPHDAFYHTVHSSPGGCEALAARMGMSSAVLRNKANPTSNFNKVNFDDVIAVMALSGNHLVLERLAADFGYVLVKVEADASPSDMAVLEIVTKCWSANGDFGAEVNRALADGKITQAELIGIRDTILRSNQVMHQLLARLEAIAEK